MLTQSCDIDIDIAPDNDDDEPEQVLPKEEIILQSESTEQFLSSSLPEGIVLVHPDMKIMKKSRIIINFFIKIINFLPYNLYTHFNNI